MGVKVLDSHGHVTAIDGPMIYTAGFAAIYEQSFRDLAPTHPKKKGRDGDYPGGSVWRTREDAQRYLDEAGQAATYRVYGVDADWDTDTEPSRSSGPWHDLLRSAWLNRLDEENA